MPTTFKFILIDPCKTNPLQSWMMVLRHPQLHFYLEQPYL